VLLRVQILADGSAGSVSVAKTSGFESLDEAALAAVRRWKFVPAKRDGNPVESVVNVPINFNLKTE
jgi:protein TonB